MTSAALPTEASSVDTKKARVSGTSQREDEAKCDGSSFTSQIGSCLSEEMADKVQPGGRQRNDVIRVVPLRISGEFLRDPRSLQ